MAVDIQTLEGRLAGLADPQIAGVSAVDAVARKWVEAPSDEAPMGYWKKPNDGYVILAHYGENGTERKMDRGYVRLGARYGTYSSAAMGELKDPLLGLVMRGGLDQMPAQQIKEIGWHRKPSNAAKRSHRAVEALIERAMADKGLSRDEALLVVMPQLREIDLTDYTCAACRGRWFPTLDAKLSHDSVAHKDQLQAEATGKAVAAANSGGGASANEALVALIAQQGDLIAEMKAEIAELRGAKAPKGKGKADPPNTE